MKFIIPELLKYNTESPICIVSNPCDIMTAVAAKIAGPSIPPGRIFGSGTCLDTSRLRSLIGDTLNVDTRNVHGYIIGEHGDSSIAVWSGVNVGGVPLLEHGVEPSDVHHAIHRNVVESAGDVINKKGYTNWAVGLAVAHIAKNVLDDTLSIMTVSTCVRGLYGIENDVYTSVPCVIGGSGVRRVVILPLSEAEKNGLVKSCNLVWDVQKGVWDSV
jgi:L-lactate dehydrogenase